MTCTTIGFSKPFTVCYMFPVSLGTTRHVEWCINKAVHCRMLAARLTTSYRRLAKSCFVDAILSIAAGVFFNCPDYQQEWVLHGAWSHRAVANTVELPVCYAVSQEGCAWASSLYKTAQNSLCKLYKNRRRFALKKSRQKAWNLLYILHYLPEHL